MADFASWATAAEQGFGFPIGSFMDAYSGNRAEAVQETLESDPVSTAVIALIDEKHDESHWTGTAKKLLADLEAIVEDRLKRSPAWPKTPRALSSRLRRLTTFLRESGVEITFHEQKGTGGRRLLTVTRKVLDLPAPTATTASLEPMRSPDQPVMANSGSGGRNPGVAVDPHGGNQPHLESRWTCR